MGTGLATKEPSAECGIVSNYFTRFIFSAFPNDFFRPVRQFMRRISHMNIRASRYRLKGAKSYFELVYLAIVYAAVCLTCVLNEKRHGPLKLDQLNLLPSRLSTTSHILIANMYILFVNIDSQISSVLWSPLATASQCSWTKWCIELAPYSAFCRNHSSICHSVYEPVYYHCLSTQELKN